MPLSVGLYISSFGPGGAERQIVNLAVELVRRGLHVTLIHAQKDLDASYFLNQLREKDVAVVNALVPDNLREGIRRSRLREDFFKNLPAPGVIKMGILYLAGAFSRIRPDIVHSYLDVHNCTTGCAAVLADVPAHLASFRSLDPVTSQNGMAELTYPLYRFLLGRSPTHFEANSRAGAAHYARWLDIPAESITYSPNGLDPQSFPAAPPAAAQALREELGIPADAPVILTLSRFVWAKAPEAMPDIFARVLAARPDCHYLVSGAGMAGEEEMGALVRKRGLQSRMHLLGPRRDVSTLLSCADVFLLPSRVEGFPNAVMEAMASGLPVVASHVGGIPDLVRHGEDGFLHAPEDVDGMAASGLRLLAEPGLRARLGEAGRQRILKEFTLKKLGDRTLARYAQLLEAGRTGTGLGA